VKGVNAAEQLSYDLFRRNYERAIEGIRFPSEYLQVTQIGGVHQSVANVVRTMPKFTLKDFKDIVARLNAVGVLVDQSEIHEIGLAEVKRLNAEMKRAITESGFKGSRGEFLKFLRTDSRFYK